MRRRLLSSILVVCTIALFSGFALADDISITFIFGGQADATKGGFSATPSPIFLVTDAQQGTGYFLSGLASVQTGTYTSWLVSGGVLTATYGPGGFVLGSNQASNCPPVCGADLITGVMQDSSYSAQIGGNGSLQGLFDITYVNPDLLALFGLGPQHSSIGSVSFNTGSNKWVERGDLQGIITGGTITFSTGTPEPGTLALMGTGIVGLAGVLRRKFNI